MRAEWLSLGSFGNVEAVVVTIVPVHNCLSVAVGEEHKDFISVLLEVSGQFLVPINWQG